MEIVLTPIIHHRKPPNFHEVFGSIIRKFWISRGKINPRLNVALVSPKSILKEDPQKISVSSNLSISHSAQ